MQTLQHSRKPFQTEITDEVAREYTRQQTEKRKAALQTGSDMDDMRARVVDMEGSVTRLEEKVGESHLRLEDMFKAIMTSQGCTPPVFRLNAEAEARSAEMQRSAPNLGEATRTRSLSRADFLQPATLFPEDFGAAVTEKTVVQSQAKETAAEKLQSDEFLEGLLQDPDAGLQDTLHVPIQEDVNPSGEKEQVLKGDAGKSVVDITLTEGGVPTAGSESDTAQAEQVRHHSLKVR